MSNVQFAGELNAGYDLTYTYGKDAGKKFQLDNVRDINYRTEGAADENDKMNNGHRYTYDDNYSIEREQSQTCLSYAERENNRRRQRNLVYINTSRVKKDGKEDEKATEQKYRWDEENRLLAADENYSIEREQSQTCLSYAERENNRPKVNGFVSNYWYDADGERTVKTSGENEAIFVNSEFSGGNTGTARFLLYVSPYLVAGQGGKYTKHIYIGSQRIVSKLGDLASYGADPRKIPYAGNEADGVKVDYKTKYGEQLQAIKDNYRTFEIPYNGQDNTDYVNGKGFCCDDNTPEAAQTRAMVRTRAGEGSGANEKLQFYYHPDHLGSSSYITNLDGEVAQHIEYVPFGEVFIEERNNMWNTPYLFNAKEFDEETGMYYYGARYYEPKLSLWMSTDPMQAKYPHISTYCYTFNNPIKFIDPNGKDSYYNEAGEFLFKNKRKTDIIYVVSGYSFIKKLKDGTKVFSLKNRRTLEKSDLSAKAYSKIFTNVLKRKGFDTRKLYNGQVSVNKLYDKYDNDSRRIETYAEDYNVSGNFLSYDPRRERGVAPAVTKKIGGKIEVCVNVYPVGYEEKNYVSTESNIVNLLGIHEFTWHGVKGVGSSQHYRILKAQRQSPSWQTTSPQFKSLYDNLEKNNDEYKKTLVIM